MCGIKTILVSICLILLVTASFCMCWVYPEKKLGEYSGNRLQKPCEKEHKDQCLNDECYYLLQEDIVGCNCSWLIGGQRCGKYNWST